MKLPRFIKLPNYYIFDYKPMYYDPDKEKREERDKTIKQELGIDTGETEYKPNIKGKFKHSIDYGRQQGKISRIRLIIVLAFIAIMVYFLFFTDVLNKLFEFSTI